MKVLIALLLIIFSTVSGFSQTKEKYPVIDIPYKKFVLKNGLTLIVSENHKIPMAAFNIWYHVGSKNEKPGKTGFAHLFEHIMFTGSEHYPDFDREMQVVGGGSNNGTTNNDRTNFFETFTSAGLDRVLWVESDRMGFLLNGLDSTKVEAQRGVVQNEKRQGDNQPYAISEELTIKSTYPAHHPYSWSVIGSLDDLAAASLDDVKKWFKDYYGPNNAVIAIAGDVNAEDVLKRVEKYFGAIPPSPPIARQDVWINKMSGTHAQEAQDRVPQPMLQKVWNVAEWGTKDITYLELLSTVLSKGVSSRLYKKLVVENQLCTEVYTYNNGSEIGQQFYVVAMAKPETDLKKVNAIIDEEMKKVITTGITPAEIELAKTTYFANFLKGIERIGGFGGVSDVLAEYETYGGSPDYYKKIQTWVKAATPADIKNAAAKWLNDGVYELSIFPYGEPEALSSTLDRTVPPPVAAVPLVKFPEIKQFTLSNGLKVYLAERHDVPLVNMAISFDAGYQADETGKEGTAKLMSAMLTEGTATKNADQISSTETALGASLSASANLITNAISLNALKSNLVPSLELFTDVVLHPSFPQKSFDRLKEEQVIAIQQEKANPNQLASRILPQLMYGGKNAFSNPLTGSGYESSVQTIKKAELSAFHKDYFVPQNASLVVAGDVSEAEIKPLLEKYMSGWKSNVTRNTEGTRPAPIVGTRVFLVDIPGAPQSVINAAVFGPAPNSKNNDALRLMNTMLGGSFLSRLNMNLREEKHWSYGAGARFYDTQNDAVYSATTSVQTDKTKESMVEVLKELKQVTSTKPISAEEFAKEQNSTLLEMPGAWETNASVRAFLQNSLIYRKGVNYPAEYPDIIKGLTLQEINNAASSVIKTENLTWLIVGDRSKIEAGIKALNFGPLTILDSNGKEVK